MKKLVLISLFAASSLFAGTIVVQQTDEIVGYDGSCTVYFQPGLGYYEVCQSYPPAFLGVEFGSLHFSHGFHAHAGFHGQFHGHGLGHR